LVVDTTQKMIDSTKYIAATVQNKTQDALTALNSLSDLHQKANEAAKSSYSMLSKVGSSLFGKMAEAFAYLPQPEEVQKLTEEVDAEKNVLSNREINSLVDRNTSFSELQMSEKRIVDSASQESTSLTINSLAKGLLGDHLSDSDGEEISQLDEEQQNVVQRVMTKD
jgi:hypothetical protein